MAYLFFLQKPLPGKRDLLLYLAVWPAVTLLTFVVTRQLLLPAWLVLAQSGILMLGNITQDARYQFSVYPIALFSIALLFLPGSPPRQTIASTGSKNTVDYAQLPVGDPKSLTPHD